MILDSLFVKGGKFSMEEQKIEALKELLKISTEHGLEKEMLAIKYLMTGKEDLSIREVNDLISILIDKGLLGMAISFAKKYFVEVSEVNVSRLAMICMDKGHYGLFIDLVIKLPHLVSSGLIEKFIKVYLEFVEKNVKEGLSKEETFRERKESLIGEIICCLVAARREISLEEIDRLLNILRLLK